MSSFDRTIIGRIRLVGLTILLAAGLGTGLRAGDRGALLRFLETAGFGTALDNIALSAEQAPEMPGLSPADLGDGWADVAHEIFESEALRQPALDILERTLSDDLRRHAETFHGSPLGLRLVRAENAAHLAADKDVSRTDGAALLTGATPERRRTLERIVALVDRGDTAVRAVQHVQLRFLMAAGDAGLLDHDLDEATLRAMLHETAAKMRAELHEASLDTAALTYRAFSEDDIAAYADAPETDDMQKVYELMNAIFYEITAERREVPAARMATLRGGVQL